jgi:hypothetical protein
VKRGGDRKQLAGALRMLSTRLHRLADACDLDAERIAADGFLHAHANLLCGLIDSTRIHLEGFGEALAAGSRANGCSCWSHARRLELGRLAVTSEEFDTVLEEHAKVRSGDDG